MSLTYKNGWYVPAADRQAFDVILKEVNDIGRILPHCRKRRTAIQAGGCFGAWAKKLSESFNKVICFEPDKDNFEALEMNTKEIPNIHIIRAGLSDKNGTGCIERIDPSNIGAHRMKEGDGVMLMSIDSLGIDDIDLIQLDVEGYEHMAVSGAINTINCSGPIVCLEMKGLGKRYGHTDTETSSMMDSLGYRVADRFHRDVLFVKQNKN